MQIDTGNTAWVLVASALVMFMTLPGLALFYGGLVRSRNVLSVLMHCFAICSLVSLIWLLFGYSLVFSEGNALIGGFGKLFLVGLAGNVMPTRIPEYVFVLFQMTFAIITPALIIGAFPERARFSFVVAFTLLWTVVVYLPVAHWVWGGGWLAQLGHNYGLGHGHVDFAGSSVVHMVGGVAALVGAKVMGPRIGKYDRDGKAVPIPGHNIPMAVLGTFILAFGWFGFNPGSTLSGTDTHIAVIAVNTMLASASGAFGAYLYLTYRFGAPDVSMLCNGMLAGLVAITAPCAFVTAPAAIFIGLVAGVLVVVSAMFIENVLKIDDPVGASSVHGTCGAWGIISLGLFADGRYGDGWNGVPGTVRGLFYGDPAQFTAECIGLIANVLWVGAVTFVTLKILGVLVGNRVSAGTEINGLDVPEMGMEGYSTEPLPE